MGRIFLFVVLSIFYICDCHAVFLPKRPVEYITSLIQTFTEMRGKPYTCIKYYIVQGVLVGLIVMALHVK